MAGNANSGKRKDKLFYDALMMELKSRDDARGLRAIARNIVEVALDKEHKDWLAATKEISNRLDGTPAQTVDMNVSDNRQARELTDAELADIAAGSSAGTLGETAGETKPNRVH